MNDDFNQTPKKSSSTRILLIIIGIVVGICCVGMLCMGGIFYTAISAIRSSDVYVEALATATTNSEVQSALGSPITPGLMMQGSIDVDGNSGNADFQIPLNGSTQSGTLYVVATKQGGNWQYSQLYVQTEDNRRIDLNR